MHIPWCAHSVVSLDTIRYRLRRSVHQRVDADVWSDDGGHKPR